MAATISLTLELPPDFRVQEVRAFHRRDALEVGERVAADGLHKGLEWGGRPACLSIHLGPGRACAKLAIDAPPVTNGAKALEAMVRRMLGLSQRVAEFEAAHREHPHLGPLISRRPGLRVPAAATPFEALTWAITGQQISVQAAVSLRRRLIQAAGLRHSGGLWCYPEAGRVAGLEEARLREAGFSQAKARALLALSRAVADRRVPLDDWCLALPVEEIRQSLMQVPGIGPWTVNYALLRGFGWLDGSLHGDVAVRRGLQALLGREARITEEEARRWLTQFSPWRALVAAHLWALQTAPKD